jgi:hypothetical protein
MFDLVYSQGSSNTQHRAALNDGDCIMIAEGTAQWAKVLPHQLVKKDKYKDYNYWSIDLEVSDKERKRLEEAGLKSYKNSNVFKFELKEYTSKGKQNEAPVIVDAAKREWTKGEIGNGSKVRVSFFAYEHQASGMHGLGKQLKAIQVIEHVPYGNGGGAGVSEFDAVETANDGVEEF